MKSAAAKRPAKAKAQPKAPSAKTKVAKRAVAKAPVKSASKTVKTKAKTAAPAKKPAAKRAAPKAGAVKVKAQTAAKTPARKTPVKTAKAVKTVKKPAAVKAAPATARRPSTPPKSLPVPMAVTRPTPIAVRKNPKLANNWKAKPIEQWTDAEAIAMPDDEYMNDKQLAFFRLKLVDLKDGILANAGQTAENLRDDTVVVPDPADRATIEEEHALELRTRDRERKLLKKIEQSIARIDAGDYGYCDETGEPIGVPRLLARPTATLSLEAQQRREMKQKMFGD